MSNLTTLIETNPLTFSLLANDQSPKDHRLLDLFIFLFDIAVGFHNNDNHQNDDDDMDKQKVHSQDAFH
jgi:hypothetical protein